MQNSAHKRFFPKIWNYLQKSAGKNFARVLFGGEGVSKSLAHGPKYQVQNHQKSVQSSAHNVFSQKIWNNLQKSAGKNFARVLFGGEGVSKSLAHGQKYQIENHLKSVQNSVDKRFSLFSKMCWKKNCKNSFVCKWGRLKIISTWTKISN